MAYRGDSWNFRILNFIGIFFIFTFIFVETFLILNQFEHIHFSNKKIIFENKNNLLKGNLFFTGDIEGFIKTSSCEGNRRLISRIAYIIKSYENYLYFDIGDFSDFSMESNKLKIPFLLEFYKYLKILAINLTKKDYYFLKDEFIKSKKVNFISANLKSSPKLANTIKTIDYFPLKLANNKKEKIIKVAVTGLTDKRRIVGKWAKKVFILEQQRALKEIIKKYKNREADFFILLYHDSFRKLKDLLSNFNYKNINLVIGSYGNFISKKLFYINGIPVAFIGNRGRVLGHIKIYNYSENKYFIKYVPIKIQYFFPEDRKIRDLIKQIS